MGYDIHSPVKQVWLPIEYNFINDHQENFGMFASAYKEKYGIDLHEIFKLEKYVEGENLTYKIKLNYTQIGAYMVGDYELAISNSINQLVYQVQAENDKNLIIILVRDMQNMIGYGFTIALPATPAVINSIDDLVISLAEN